MHPHAQLRLLDLRPQHLPPQDTTHRNADGTYQSLTAEHVFKDYQYSKDHKIALPPLEPELQSQA